MVKEVGTIYETDDYSLFKKLKGNRDVKSVKAIINSINNIGYIKSPIMVNQDYEVIDGQNRLEACEQLGLPVHYYFVEGASIEQARWLNIGRSNWRPSDYVKSYSEYGIEDYVNLQNFIDEFEEYSFQEIIGIAKNYITTGGAPTRLVCDGAFKFSNAEYSSAKMRAEYLKSILKQLRLIKGSNRIIVTGVSWALTFKSVDKSRLKKVICDKYPLLNPVVDTDIFLSELSDLYNKGLKSTDKWVDLKNEYKKERLSK